MWDDATIAEDVNAKVAVSVVGIDHSIVEDAVVKEGTVVLGILGCADETSVCVGVEDAVVKEELLGDWYQQSVPGDQSALML